MRGWLTHPIEVLASSEAMPPHRGKKTTHGGGREVLEDIGSQKDFDVFLPSLRVIGGGSRIFPWHLGQQQAGCFSPRSISASIARISASVRARYRARST